MKYVQLGTTDLQVSAVAFGCMSLTPETAKQGKAAVLRAIELGLNFFDNADVYSRGHSEVILGEALPHSDWQKQREAGIVAQLQPFAEKYGLTVGQLSLAWLMQLPGGVIPLVGTANAEHIAEAAAAANSTLIRDDWYELMVIARGRPMPWGQRPYVYLKER
jgi:aryl-alcohol dehydrogenase-like predicted oxidoreductase